MSAREAPSRAAPAGSAVADLAAAPVIPHPVRTRAHPNTRALAYLRIAVGLLFLMFGEYKVVGTRFTLGGGFQHWIQSFLTDGTYPFMAPVLRRFVLPHGTAIAFVVAYGELAIGIALTLGLLVRVASACGCIYMLTLLFSANYPGAGVAPWQYFGAALNHLVLACCFATFVAGRPAEVLSVRPYLRWQRARASRSEDA